MNIFGFRPFKGKFNLGNADDIPENNDGTLIGSVKEIKSALTNVANRTNANKLSSSSARSLTLNVEFIAPNDGYIWQSQDSPSSAAHQNDNLLQIAVDNNFTNPIMSIIPRRSQPGYAANVLFVKKGMHIKWVGTSTANDSVTYYPLVN